MRDNIRTLSTNSASNRNDLDGLLYVPDLQSSDPCTNLSAQYVLPNVTRRANLPSEQYPFVALAPWMTPNCTKSYLAAAYDASAFIFYLTDSHTGIPPPVNDEAWNLNDGGSWKSENAYPVYAIPSNAGRIVMHQLAVYSGIPTNGSRGDLLTAAHSSSNYSRLYTTIATNTPSALPSLWAFLLIVLGVVLFLVGITSLSMHCIQRRKRRALQRRVAAGEVDLEALGIKKLTVPQEALDKLPTFTYVAEEEPAIDTQRTEPQAKTHDISCVRLSLPEVGSKRRSGSEPPHTVPPRSTNGSSPLASPWTSPSLTHRQLTYSQPICTICIEDFESQRTVVRKLPCQHIYHPKCIDTFLTKSSSLCPVCKTAVLQKGYCPEKITNAMVRSERQVRRRQQRETPETPEVIEEGQSSRNGGNLRFSERPVTVGRRMASFHRQFGRPARTSDGDNRSSSAPTAPTALEMSDRTSNPPPAITEASSRPVIDLNERRRRRISELLGHQPTADDEDRERRAGMSRCKSHLYVDLSHNSTISTGDWSIDYCTRAKSFRIDISRISLIDESNGDYDIWKLGLISRTVPGSLFGHRSMSVVLVRILGLNVELSCLFQLSCLLYLSKALRVRRGVSHR